MTAQQAVEAHIEAQRRLRARAAAAIAAAWSALPSYDETDVPAFLARAVPVTTAAQHTSVALTAAFLARRLRSQPASVPAAAILAQVRNGTPPADVYRRPFVTVWSALKDGKLYEDAAAAGLARASSTAEMDVQLAMRQTLVTVGQVDERILGYQRVPDAGACEFCRLIAGQRYTTDQLMPVHNRCGCGVDVITADNRGDFTGKPENDLSATGDGISTAVVDHGELGPLVVNGADHFTAL